MKIQKIRMNSTNFFHSPPDNLNCAQAVLKGFQTEFSVTDQEIDDFRAWGGGRTEDGVCGALFAAESLLRQAGKLSIQEEFLAQAGDIYCLNIKEGKFSCVECVGLADELVKNRMK